MQIINQGIRRRDYAAMRSWQMLYLYGLLIILVLYIPLIVLNRDALLMIHDQLDGEMLSYILSADNIMNSKIPQLFDGVNKSAATPPTPFFVLLYRIFPSWLAYIISYIFVAVASYTGMFLCLKELLGKRGIALSVAVVFAMLPFYPAYGLSIMGQPLLLYTCLLLYKDKKNKIPYILIIIFAACSSLVLVGYVDIIILGMIVAYLFVVREDNRQRLLIALCILLLSYSVLNFGLLKEMLLGVEAMVSHREEVVAQSIPIRTAFWDMLENGQYHAVSNHRNILYIAVIVFFCVITGYGRLQERDKKRFNQFLILILYVIFVAGFYAVWKFLPVVNLRNALGGLFVSFQVDRFYCLYPAAWYLILGYALYFIIAVWNTKRLRCAGKGMIVLVLILFFQAAWDKSNLKINFNRLKDSSYAQPGYASWNEFYAEDLFEDIKEYIDKPVSEYKVGSVGLYPAIPLYNGFYCVDGYSNNYDIEYKHKFRKVIAGELDKNEEIKRYYDDWGNRCYLFSSEIPFRYYIGKHSREKLEDLQFDFNVLKEMDCEYLLSTLPIENRESELEFEKKFEVETSPYCIYLYRIK